MKSSRPKAAIFDLDGTLVDSADDIAEALTVACTPLGADPFTRADVVEAIGGGSLVLIRRVLAMRDIAIDDAGFEATRRSFMAAYGDVSALGRGLYPGAHELLDALGADGCRLALCTNKPEDVTHVAVKALGLQPRLHAVVGAREDVPKKPAPDMIFAALRAVGVAPADAIMIGDSRADIGAAKAAGVRSIVLRHGYSKTPVDELGADWVCGDLAAVGVVMRGLG